MRSLTLIAIYVAGPIVATLIGAGLVASVLILAESLGR